MFTASNLRLWCINLRNEYSEFSCVKLISGIFERLRIQEPRQIG